MTSTVYTGAHTHHRIHTQPSVIFHPECHLRVIKTVINQNRKVILLQKLKLYWLSPLYCICWQPDSPLNTLLYLSKQLQTCCKGVLFRILLIITQQGPEKASVGDAPVAQLWQHVHPPVRCTATWVSWWSCNWPVHGTEFACVCVCSCVTAGVSLETSVNRGWLCSWESNDLFTALIALSANRSPSVFTSIWEAHWFYKTTVKLATASMFWMKVLYLDLAESGVESRSLASDSIMLLMSRRCLETLEGFVLMSVAAEKGN